MQSTLLKLYCSVHPPSTNDKSTLYQSPKLSMQRFQLLFKPRSACTSVVEHGILCKRGPGLSDFASVLTAYELEIFTHTVQYSNYPVQVTSQYRLRASDGKFSVISKLLALARLMCLSLSLIQTFSVALGHRVDD